MISKNLFRSLFGILLLNSFLFASYKDYTKNQDAQKFIEKLAKNSSYSKKELNSLFSKVKVQNYPLKFYKVKSIKKADKNKKTVKKGSWDRYENQFLTQKRINLGAKFMKENKKALNKAYKKYGVQPEFITAIIGIESFYGSNLGRHNVFDTLVTLSFEKNRRQSFFKDELEHFLLYAKKSGKNPNSIYGSYAGAIGLAQFMPSSIRNIAVDFDKNGKIDLTNKVDAIGSVAKYFNEAGWNKKIPVATRVSYKGNRFDRFETGFKHKYKRSKLKGIYPKKGRFYYNKEVHLIKLDRKKFDELWYGTKNFYTITRYNRSNYYAMAVYQLAKNIKKKYKKMV